jgi:LAS superfamily LD-carboxypeptidase LdcB
MVQHNQTKAERKEARAVNPQTKAERKQARARKRQARLADAAAPAAPAEGMSPDERIELRLIRIEEAMAGQSERTEELLDRLDAMLDAAAQPGTQASRGDAGPDGLDG